MAYHHTSNFLKFFSEFARVFITPDKFGRDWLGNVQIKDDALFRVIVCLFEGISRQIPAFNYL